MKFRFVIFIFLLLCAFARANITSQVNRSGPYTASVLPAVVSVVFPYQQASDILVLNLGNGGTANDPPIVLTLNSDYTVSGGGYNATTNMLSGNVTILAGGAHNVQVNDQIVILRNVPVNQASSLVSGVFSAAAVEKALDKQATLSQQLTETVNRALQFEPGETVSGVMTRTARANKTLGFDANGNILFGPGGGGAGTTYSAGAGLLLVTNVFSVNPTQSLTNLTVSNTIVGSVTGNAGTATVLQTARAINGVNFDGSAGITVTASASTLTGSALAVGVTSAPGLLSASIGTFGTMAIQNANSISVSGGTITGAAVTGLSAPVGTTDAANKAYVDAVAAGATPRVAVVAATTVNIVLSAPQTIDGQSVIAGNRVLVKNQTLTQNNGIYDVAAGAWTRSTDSDTAAELKLGYYYFVTSGTTQAATSWFISTAPTNLGVDPVVFSQYSASQNYTAGFGLVLGANQFSLNPSLSGLTITASTGSFTALNSTSGNLNGTIGLTTPAAGAFTTLGSTGVYTYLNNATNPAIFAGVSTHLTQADSTDLTILMDVATGTPSLVGRRSEGSMAAPAATSAGGLLINIIGRGWANGAYTLNAGRFSIQALNLWSATDNSTQMSWLLTPSGGLAVTQFQVMNLTTNALTLGNTSGSTTTNLNLVNATGAANIISTTAAGAGTIKMQTSEGTTLTPLYPGSGRQILALQGWGYDQNAATYQLRGGYEIQTTEAWSATAQGTKLRFRATATGTLTTTDVGIMDGSGNLNMTGGVQYVNSQNVRSSGAKGNGTIITGNTSITTGTAALTVVGAAFVVGDIGKTIVVPGAGVAGANLLTTIAGWTSSTQVTLTGNASTTLSAVSTIVAYGTDDTAALNTALAALTNYSTLLLPPGIYIHSGLTFPASKTNVILRGDQAMLYLTTNANNTLVVPNTCSYITFDGIWFNGVGTSRQNGIHLRINSDFTTVRNCRIERSSDWGIQVDSAGSAVKGFLCVNNYFKDTCGDGVHVMNVDGYNISNNIFWQCGDDAIAALAQSTTIQPLNGNITGNYIYGRQVNLAGTNTHGFRGIVVMIAKNVLIQGNTIYNTYAAAIEASDEYNSSLYNEEVAIKDNLIFNANFIGGPLGAIQMYFCQRSTVTGNQITNPLSASGIAFCDNQQVTYSDNQVQQSVNQFCRGVVTNTSTPYIGRAILASNDVVIANNKFDLRQASNNEALYLVFTTGIRCNNLAVIGNYGRSTALAYITTDWIITGKFLNNGTIGGTTSPSTGGNSTGITSTNNN